MLSQLGRWWLTLLRDKTNQATIEIRVTPTTPAPAPVPVLAPVPRELPPGDDDLVDTVAVDVPLIRRCAESGVVAAFTLPLFTKRADRFRSYAGGGP